MEDELAAEGEEENKLLTMWMLFEELRTRE